MLSYIVRKRSRRLPGTRISAHMVSLLSVIGLTAAVQARPASTDWQDYIAGPTTRLNAPVAITYAENNAGSITNPDAVLVEDGTSATITRSGSTTPRLAIDFGLPVSGKVEIVFGSTVNVPLKLAFSQRLEYLDIGSDTSEFALGDLSVTGRPGVTWRTDDRRTFRYLLLYMPVSGTVTIDAVRIYHTPFLGSENTYDGHFLCDDDLLNRIWYGCIYTQEICTTSGDADIDGPWEIEDGMLSVAYEGNEFGFTRDGAGWTDYALDFDFKIMPLGQACGWAFRATDANNTYMWQIVADEASSNTNTLRKRVRQNGGWSSTTTVNLPAPLHEGVLHHIRTELDGTTIRTYLDDELIDTTTDATFAQGRIGFYAAPGDHFHVDNVVVSDDANTLFTDAFDGPSVPALTLKHDKWELAELLTILDGAKRDRAWWLGDLYPSQRTMYVAHMTPDVLLPTLQDAADHQFDQSVENQYGGILRGKMPASGATGVQYMTSSAFNAFWLDDYTFWWVLTVHHHWMHTGDIAFVSNVYPNLQGVLEWADRKVGPSGLIRLAQGDWYWSFLRFGEVTSFNALYVRTLRCSAEMADALGFAADAAAYTARADAVETAINTYLYDASQQLYYDAAPGDHEWADRYPLDGNSLAVLYGVADAPKVGPILDQIQTRMWSPVGTRAAWPTYPTWGHDQQVWTWYVEYEVEARFRYNDDLRALEAIRRPWGTMVDGDPGRTMWEFMMGDGTTENGLRNTDHAFSAGAAWLLSEYVAGIRPTSPGFATFDLVPHPGDLTWVQCTMPTPAGGISVEYSLDPDAKTYDATVTIPAASIGRVAVPKLGTLAQVTLDGQPAWTEQGPIGDATEDDHYLYFPELGPGTHVLAAIFDVGIVDPDFDFDRDVDQTDFAHLQACLTGNGIQLSDDNCTNADLDGDQDVDQTDVTLLQACKSGANVQPDLACDD